MDPRAKDYFNKFKSTLPEEDQGKLPRYDSYYFCADEENANICA
ncbi:MAG: RNA-binding protein, partial [Chloroflexota bacterium]